MTAASLLRDAVNDDTLRRAAPARVALLADYREEGWPSMDLVADMTYAHLATPEVPEVVELVRPAMRRRMSGAGELAGLGFTADRALARYWDYPRHLRAVRGDFDLFHVLDHSYAHLALSLPAGRTIMHCHDVDAFRSVLDPAREPRSLAFRTMTRRLLAGLRRAARVLTISSATRDALLAYDVLPPERVEVAYLGVHPSCTPAPHVHADAAAVGLLGPLRREAPEVLHVGSTIARKRVDVLLQAFARVAGTFPEARLVRAGGALTDAQRALAERLGIAHRIVTLPFITREVLAAVYRRAGVVLQTSDAEGFGLPVAEAMACGTPVVASDLAVLREVGGDEATYAPVGDAAAFGAAAVQLLLERDRDPAAWEARRARGIAQASAFTWAAHGERVLGAYRRTLDELHASGRGRVRA